MEEQCHQLTESIQVLIEVIRAEEPISSVRNNLERIVGTVERVLSSSARGGNDPSPYQAEWRSQTGEIEQKLEEVNQRLLRASHEAESFNQKSSAKEFTQKLPPLAFQVARETRELVRRVQELRSGGDDDCR